LDLIDSRNAELAAEPGILGPKDVWKPTDSFASSPSKDNWQPKGVSVPSCAPEIDKVGAITRSAKTRAIPIRIDDATFADY
jgi:hypothetical protein